MAEDTFLLLAETCPAAEAESKASSPAPHSDGCPPMSPAPLLLSFLSVPLLVSLYCLPLISSLLHIQTHHSSHILPQQCLSGYREVHQKPSCGLILLFQPDMPGRLVHSTQPPLHSSLEKKPPDHQEKG